MFVTMVKIVKRILATVHWPDTSVTSFGDRFCPRLQVEGKLTYSVRPSQSSTGTRTLYTRVYRFVTSTAIHQRGTLHSFRNFAVESCFNLQVSFSIRRTKERRRRQMFIRYVGSFLLEKNRWRLINLKDSIRTGVFLKANFYTMELYWSNVHK
jgi:hypothetical protein